jgi:hypothetical protein
MFTSLLVLGWVLAAPAPAADNPDLRVEVRKLVRQLDAAQLAQRDAAEEKLLGMGPRVLELLPEPSAAASEEVKQRLGRIRQKLQLSAAKDALQPSTVTLSAQAMPLSKVLAAIQAQTQNPIELRLDSDGDPALNVALDKTPFWQALDGVLDQAKRTVYPFGQSRAIQVVPRDVRQLPRVGRASYSGPFRIEPVRVAASRDLRNPAGQSLLVTVEVAWEPRLKLIGLKQRMADMAAVDDRGDPLPADDKEAEVEAMVRSDSAAQAFDLPLALPPRSVKEIASLKGTLLAMVPGKIETFRFGDLLKAKNVQQRIAGATVTLEQVRKNNDLWELRMRVGFDEAGDALESHRNWILENEAWLEDADGKPILHDSMGIIGRSKNEAGMTYVYSLKDPPANLTFVYKTPGTIVTTRFPYELKDIRLP